MGDPPDYVHPPLIAVAEDDSALREVIVHALRTAGYDVCEYDRGDTLLERLLHPQSPARVPALVVTDNCMAGQSGITVLRDLRARGCMVPVVLITAFGSEELVNDAIRVGADVVLRKPFDIGDFLRIVACFFPPRRPRGR
jgi:two-component system response regulator FixJ